MKVTAMQLFSRFWYGMTLPFHAWRILAQIHGRRYVFIPILLNVVLAVLMFRYGVSWYIIGQLTALMNTRLSSELQWLIPIITNILEIAAFVLITFTAVRIGTIIGSPFYVAIAERIDIQFIGHDETPPQSLFAIIGSAVWYEARKLCMVLGTWVIGALLELIPLIGIAIGSLWIVLTSGMIALLDYTDVSFGRRSIPVAQRLRLFVRFLPEALGFALIVVPCTAIPIVNTITVPLCICGGVLWYVERMRAAVSLPVLPVTTPK